MHYLHGVSSTATLICTEGDTWQAYPNRLGKTHIPLDLVVDHWASDGESSSHRPFLIRYDVWTIVRRQIHEKITLILSMVWHFTTQFGGIWKLLYTPVMWLFPRRHVDV
jgi:hypothetical protein